MIVTIDGPAGSGKSTVAAGLASALGFAHLDTGATYRAATLKALQSGADMEDESALLDIARRAKIELVPQAEASRVLLDGRDVTTQIRTSEVTDNVHHLASCPAGRQVLVDLQRRLGAMLADFVAEGRDQGSVVFPNADVKFFLTASPEVRARRRAEELTGAGEQVAHEQVLRAITERDEHDQNRDVAPLVKAEGAVEIDTTDMTVAEVVDELRTHVEAAR